MYQKTPSANKTVKTKRASAFAAALLTSLLLPSLSIEASFAANSTGTKPTSLPAHLISVPTNDGYYGPYVFVVDKSARSLEIWQSVSDGKDGFQFIRSASHPADLGKNSGDKIAEGDHKTPEGIYFLLEKLEGPTLDFSLYGSRAYTTNYPNHFDIIDGKTGSGIWLHSVPDSVPLTRGSRGCVVVRNNIVTTFDPYIQLNRTPIIISDSIETRSPADAIEANRKLVSWLDAWRAAWESKDLDSYMSFYDDGFKSMGMSKSQWRTYKERLNRNYQTITVQISQPLALEHRGRAIVRFVQRYASDQVSDIGEKTLHLTNINGDWKILSETWRADASPAALAAVTDKEDRPVPPSQSSAH
jgi:murein L,D-transpeptidase YafK